MPFRISYSQRAHAFSLLNGTSKHNALFLMACLFLRSWNQAHGVNLRQCDTPEEEVLWVLEVPIESDSEAAHSVSILLGSGSQPATLTEVGCQMMNSKDA